MATTNRHETNLSVLYATAELDPLIKVGGLGEASAGLVGGLESVGVDVEVIIPDYGHVDLADEHVHPLRDLPSWCPPITARTGWLPHSSQRSPASGSDTPVTVLAFDGSQRPHPYVDPATGEGWEDATRYFMRFCAGIAAYARDRQPDLVHLNDWHTAATAAMLPPSITSVLTIHNLAYQGVAERHWVERCGDDNRHPKASRHLPADRFNPLAVGIAAADRIVMVSEAYTAEVLSPEGGCGLDPLLESRRADLSGIRNGIDVGLWNPADDHRLPANFNHQDLSGKDVCRKELMRMSGLEPDRGPVIGLVARLVRQKGIDLALELVPFLESLSARLVLMGSGSPVLAQQAREMADRYPDQLAVYTEYDEQTAHLIVAGSDLLLVPSRFEPCGLTQMQAMTCGTIPVVSGVGGLRDTVTDTDTNPRAGTGYVAQRPAPLELLDALHRATKGWTNGRRRAAIQRRGMVADWSWAVPAGRYNRLYSSAVAARSA